jgi:hypothetical protein
MKVKSRAIKNLFAMILAGIVLASCAFAPKARMTENPEDFKTTKVAKLHGGSENAMMSSDHRFVNGTVTYFSDDYFVDYSKRITYGRPRIARDVMVDLNGDGSSDCSVAMFGNNNLRVGSDIILERSPRSIAKEKAQKGAAPEITYNRYAPGFELYLFDGTIVYIDGIPVKGQNLDYVQDFIDYAAARDQYFDSKQSEDDYKLFKPEGESYIKDDARSKDYERFVNNSINIIMITNRLNQKQ